MPIAPFANGVAKPISSKSPTATKLALRLSKILALLHHGDDIDKHALAKQYDVSVRTIERDLADRLHGIAEQTNDGHWQLAHPHRSTIPTAQLNEYTRLVGAAHLFPDTSLPYLITQLENQKSSQTMHVQPIPHEDIRIQGPVFALLQGAIECHHECRFSYKGKPRRTQPYRLIHKNGVWYLAAEEAGRLKNFSVALIEGLQVDEYSSFNPKRAYQDHINARDDVWFTDSTTEVLLRVAPEVARYFTRRALLPRQQQRADADGSLLVTTQISHINQLIPMVRYWLPHVRIVQPTAWHQALIDNLRQTLVQWEPQTAGAGR